MKYQNFSYHGDHYASHFEYGDHGEIDSIVAESTIDGTARSFPVETLVLAAGKYSLSQQQMLKQKTSRQ